MSAVGGGGTDKSASAVCCNRFQAMACSIKHAAVDALIASPAPAGSRKKSVGIHTYISGGLCGNTVFTPRHTGGVGSREMSLQLGRKVDHAFTARIKKKTHSNERRISVRVRQIVSELGRRGIHTVGAQILVGMADRGIAVRTELDGLGCTADGSPVVIEIKATGATVAQHKAGYHLVCIKRPRMVTGDPNSTFVRHQVQVGFGALCISATKGVIVVSCSDGVVSYSLENAFRRRELFEHKFALEPWRQLLAPEIPTMVAWPSHDAPLIAALSKVSGFERISLWKQTACVPASVRFDGGPKSGFDVVVCVVVGRWTKVKKKAAQLAASAVGGSHRFAVYQSTRHWKAMPLA